MAHLSIYEFFGRFASGQRILDAGSGAGYGSRYLRDRGATKVEGIDLDPRHVRYAQKRYGGRGVSFRVADCERLAFESDSFDLVVSSNVLEHLESPAAFLRAAASGLSATGVVLVAVPWIVDESSRAQSSSNEFHRSNLTADEWADLFAAEGWQARVWVQTFVRERGVPDFFDPRRTARSTRDFVFVEAAPTDVRRPWPLGLVYRLDRL